MGWLRGFHPARLRTRFFLCDENEALILLNLSQGSLITTANLYYLQSRFSNQLLSAGCNRQNTSLLKRGFMLPMLPHILHYGTYSWRQLPLEEDL